MPSLAAAAREVMREPARAERPRCRRRSRRTRARMCRRREAPQRAESVADFLAQVPMFAGLRRAAARAAGGATRARSHLAAGEWLFREGEDADCLFVVRAGRLEIVDRRLRRGACCACSAAARRSASSRCSTSSPRSASVRAARDSDVIAIDRDAVRRAVRRGAGALALGQPRRWRCSCARAAERSSTQRPAPRDGRAAAAERRRAVRPRSPRRLSDALAAYGAVATLDETVAPRPRCQAPRCSRPTARRSTAPRRRATSSCSSRERSDATIRGPSSAFSRPTACSRSRAAARSRRRFASAPSCAAATSSRSPSAPGAGALAGWAELLDPIETHALPRAALDDGLERMARRLTGNSVGVVLSGGGARALSHIGVIEELLAAGVRIDRVAGVSMGAYIGGMLAAGMAPEEIDARCYEEWVRRRPLSDFTLPRHSLIRGARVEAMLERTFGTLAIEELERSFFCASGELRSGELVVHRWGTLVKRVGESIALPILGPPVRHGRRILVDGSLVDNLPVGAMAELDEGPVIAVDVKATTPPKAARSRPETPIGSRHAPGSALRARERSPAVARRDAHARAAARQLEDVRGCRALRRPHDHAAQRRRRAARVPPDRPCARGRARGRSRCAGGRPRAPVFIAVFA